MSVFSSQRSSSMPYERYTPYKNEFSVELPDRQWPGRVTEKAPAGARSTCGTATRP